MHTSEDGYVASVFCFVFFKICDLISRLCEDTVEDSVFFPSRDRIYYFSVDVH